ncbi:ELM1/GtrOC1 family putative glycosyltransferase [Ancylobacter terrae]|uniref:ELM1/GtrOC1 family putative glycosyltransferase n=1 Tax=Ancylobacter sp. sgz301288 TaxID=3342077 RepID=UPI00385E15A0
MRYMSPPGGGSVQPGQFHTVQILVLKDRKPGHYRQAEAIAERLSSIEPARIEAIDIEPRWYAHEALRRSSSRWSTRPDHLLRAFYGLRAADLTRADIVVGSGRPTILAGLLLARLWGGRFVYRGIGTGYSFGPQDLVLVASPRAAGNANRIYVPVPAPIDPDTLPPPRRIADSADLRGASTSLLVGGDSTTHRFVEADWNRLAAFVEASADTYGIRWSITNSRRTPDAVSDMWTVMAARRDDVTFIDWRTAGVGSIDRLLAADVILVTSDSVSMIGDACNAMRPVLALDPASTQPAGAADVANVFAETGQLERLSIADLDPAALAPTLARLVVPPVSHRRHLEQVLTDWLALRRRAA